MGRKVHIAHHLMSMLQRTGAQAKAGLVDAAFDTFAEMERAPHHVLPDAVACNTLVDACARAHPPRPKQARHVLDEIVPRLRLRPDR